MIVQHNRVNRFSKTTIILLIFFSGFTAWSQHSVKGKVFDISQLKPVSLCNIYIVGTTIGTSTDSLGQFSLDLPDKGSYELVFSHINYLPQLLPIEVTEEALVLDPMPLDPISTATGTIVVSGKKDRKWQRQYERFLSYIMGSHFKKSNVEIANPYDVEFKSAGKGMTVQARPFTLNMRNSFTGYEIHFLVQRLFLSKTNQFMVGYPGFTPLTATSDEEAAQWKKNRERSFRGSLRHVFKSVIENKLEAEGFGAQLVEKNPAKFQGAASKILPIEIDNTINLNSENLFEHVIITDTDDPDIKKITLTELLRVTYTMESDAFGKQQQTLIEAIDNEFLVYTNGIPVNPTSLKLYGYLATEGLYEMLPFDY